MATVDQVEALLNETAREIEEKQRQASDDAQSTSSRRREDNYRDHDRHRRSDRYDRREDYGRLDRPDHLHDRRDRRDRDNRGREPDYFRESSGDRRRSRERDNRRSNGSRAGSNDGADTDEVHDTRSRRSNSRERYRGGRRDRGAGGDYYSGGGRARTRSPVREREDRHRDRSRGPRRGDDRRGGHRDKQPEPEVTEDEKDKRTVFVQQISQRAQTRNLREFFEAIGPVVDAQIVKDRVTGRSKGVGYVEFKSEATVAIALEMTGQKLKGVPIIVQLTEAEKNRAARPSEGGGAAAGANGAPFHRLYVGNIHFSVTEKDLREIFEPYGELEQVTLQRDEAQPGRSKGYGFVQYLDPANAKEALQQMNGFELAGRQIRVGLGNDKFTPESTANLLRTFTQQAQNYTGSAFSGAGGRGAYAGGTGGVFDRTHNKDDRGVSGASALDDSDVAGVNFKAYDRSKLMAALAERDNPQPKQGAAAPLVVKPRAPTFDKPMASKCIKIENAFDPDEELKSFGDKWAKELEVEVKTELNKKYGNVVHIAVDPNTDGDIYAKFDSVTGGEKALQGLNGRSFNHRIIRASYVVDKIYQSLWGAAADKSGK